MAKTSFMMLSDTHNFERTEDVIHPIARPHPKVDVLLHCGDLTQGIMTLDREYWHSHLEEDDEPEEHDEAVAIMSGPRPRRQSFSIYASPYQPECGDWAFGYKRTEDRFNLQPAPGLRCIAQRSIPDNVNIVMTHGPPRGVLDLIPDRDEHAGCDAILHATQRVRPLMHCFGHIHEGNGVEVKTWNRWQDVAPQQVTVKQLKTKGETTRTLEIAPGSETLMVNAAVMDDSNIPCHAPWIIELELPVR